MNAINNTVEWVLIGGIKYISFISTDVVIYASGCFIKFLNLITNKQHFLLANRHSVHGEGIRAIRGHRAVHVFAYAECCRESVIYVKEYPSLKTIVKFEDGPREGYSTLVFSETSLLIALGAMPNFVISIWNWRRKMKFGELISNIALDHQMLRCSWKSPVSMAQLGTGSDKFYLWDVFTCCKTVVLAKHELKFHKDEFKLAQFNDALFTPEGKLYVVDLNGCFYSVTSEFALESEVVVSIDGNAPTGISLYQSGIAVCGPNNEIRHYVQNESWECDWKIVLDTCLSRMFCNKTDYLVGLTVDEETIVTVTRKKIKTIKRNRTKFNDFGLIYPTGEYFAAIRQNKILEILNTNDGVEVSSTELNAKALVLTENPELPYIAIGYDNGILELISVYKPKQPTVITVFHLTNHIIKNVKFFEQGRLIVAGCSDTGEFFIIEGLPGTKMKVIATVFVNRQIVDFMLVGSRDCYRLFLIPVTTNCMAGDILIRYCVINKHNVNVKEFHFENQTFYYHKLVPTTSSNRDRIFYGLPSNSRNIHVLETKRGDPMVRIISEIKTGHQMRHFGLHITKYYAVTWGYDGFIFVRDNKFEKQVGMALPHHRYHGGVRKAYIDPLGKYIISLGKENNLVCTNIVANKIDKERKKYLEELRDSVKFELMFKRPTIGFKAEGRFQNKNWLEVEEILRKEREEELCKIERNDIMEEFNSIKSEVMDLFTKNLEGPENEKLDVMEFNLDTGLYHAQRRLNREKCHHTENYLKNLIVAQDKVTQYLMDNYWHKMKENGRVLYGFFVNTMVVRYTILPDNLEKIKRLAWLEELRKMEKVLSVKGNFLPWYRFSEEDLWKSTRKPKLPPGEYNNINVSEVIENLEIKYHHSPEALQALHGSITSQYIELSPGHYDQRQICTFYQCDIQQIVAEFELLKLKRNFNIAFDELVKQKFREMDFILERNARLRYIISEFNYFSTNKINLEIPDPKWAQVEQPEQLTTVMDHEMTITPYISPSEQAILDAKAAEEERIRLALLADDFKERALMAMMNGVLEVRWEDELRIEVPIPKCMIEKEPEKYNEEDLRAVRSYEEKVAFLRSERERYKNILDNTFTKISVSVRDLIRKFDQKVRECLTFKMNIDSANNHENLKVNRVRWRENVQIKMMLMEEQIQHDFEETEEVIDELRHIIPSLNEALSDCKDDLEVFQLKEKTLDKAFKKEIQDMTSVAQECAIKLYKRRPKTVFRYVVSSALYTELAKCVLSRERSLLLTDDCLDFLRALDQMDEFIGLPPVIDENIHRIICKHRRLKIDFELRLKTDQMQFSDGETTVDIYQKRLHVQKEKCFRLQAESKKIRLDYLYQIHNVQIQIVIRRGLVELPLTGSFRDFEDAILLPKKEILDVNKLIKEAGNKKIQAIMANMAFRRHVMTKEWEHKKLRMEINDLIDHLEDIDSVQFTREMRDYLSAKAAHRRMPYDSAETEIENISKVYHCRLRKVREKYAKIKKQLQSFKDHNDALDKAIQSVNVDVCHLELEKDEELTGKEHKALEKRMGTLLRRSRLLQQIQDNHNEIMILQTELEILRLKRYPTFKFKLINN